MVRIRITFDVLSMCSPIIIYTLKKAILINRRPMTELTQNLSLAQARSLIDSYAFDLGHVDAERLLQYWLELYQASWIRLATIEALYLGRYKAISIEQILNVWLRIGSPNPHFTYEFERLICRKLPKHLCNLSQEAADEAKPPTLKSDRLQKQTTSTILTSPVKGNKQTLPTEDEDGLKLEKAFDNPEDSSANTMPLISAWGLSYKSNWSEFTEGDKMIHQFIPLPDVSSFFNKLKTFGEEKLEGQ